MKGAPFDFASCPSGAVLGLLASCHVAPRQKFGSLAVADPLYWMGKVSALQTRLWDQVFGMHS